MARYLLILYILSPLTLLAGERDTVVVAQDGSGDFLSIQEAIVASRAFQTYTKVILIKNGVYREKIIIDDFFTHLKLIGESVAQTIITFDDSPQKKGIGTFNSYTFKVLGNHTTLENLTVQNTAGRVGQAVALHVEADYCIVKNCRIKGNQDTLYAAGQRSRQYFKDCYIEGTTDFIFGASTAVFDDCVLHCKKNSYITAASTLEDNPFGYVFRNCRLTADPEVDKVYLGRPWRDHAKVVFINCEMGRHIVPEGWHNWGKPNREKTAFYAEYGSQGSGANPSNRVTWSYQLSDEELKNYNLKNIYQKSSEWSPKP